MPPLGQPWPMPSFNESCLVNGIFNRESGIYATTHAHTAGEVSLMQIVWLRVVSKLSASIAFGGIVRRDWHELYKNLHSVSLRLL